MIYCCSSSSSRLMKRGPGKGPSLDLKVCSLGAPWDFVLWGLRIACAYSRNKRRPLLQFDWLSRRPVHNGEGSSVGLLASANTNDCCCYDPNSQLQRELPLPPSLLPLLPTLLANRMHRGPAERWVCWTPLWLADHATTRCP